MPPPDHLPGLLHTVLHRPVDEQKVDVVRLQFCQALVDGIRYSLPSHTHDASINFGCHEYLISSHTTLSDALPYFCLVLISLCRIDMTETSLQSQTNILSRSLASQCPRTDTYLRDFIAIIQLNSLLHHNYTPATTSISTNAPFGSVLTATAERAGYGSAKNSA